MECTTCVMCRFGALLIIIAFAHKFCHRFELLLIPNGFLHFPSIQTFTNSSSMITDLKDVALKLVDISNQRLYLSLQNRELIRTILPRTVKGWIEAMLPRIQAL